ncbi:hypothetical protein B0T17DRAFT_620095 [Bombardia bombarda]|uniref:Uncharacterized protein n=1 Tax=Bombardia bombarda TaxID=252184 RepID=A0AA40BVK2_9PEZI|nr:hypothetical protein B0T17DRAFT_620095 [Bombardia bombarda]
MASDSVCLDPGGGGFGGPLVSLRLLHRLRYPLPFLVDLLALFSNVLTTIATSTVSLGTYGFCDTGDAGWCYMGIGVYSVTLRMAQGLLIGMAVILAPTGIVIHRLRSGVPSNPWAIEILASLSAGRVSGDGRCKGLGDIFGEIESPEDGGHLSFGMIKRKLDEYTFTLGRYQTSDGREKYGILGHSRTSPAIETSDSPEAPTETHELETIITTSQCSLPIADETAPQNRHSSFGYYSPSLTSQYPLLQSDRRGESGRCSESPSSLDVSISNPTANEHGPSNDADKHRLEPISVQIEIQHVPDISRDLSGHPNLDSEARSIQESVRTTVTRGYPQSSSSERHLIPSILTVEDDRSPTSGQSPQPETVSPPSIPQQPEQLHHPHRKRDKSALIHLGLQLVFFVLLLGFFVLVVYYEAVEVQDPDPNSFEGFMDSQGLGVGILFTGLAVGITLFWDYLFGRIATLDPYRLLAHRPQPYSTLLAPRPSTAFSGLALAVQQRDLLLLLTSFAGILSKFIPILVAHIPFHSYQTWAVHAVTAWTTVAIMGYMIVVLLGCLVFVEWPFLPVAPDSIAGAVYYCFDSRMVRDSDGVVGEWWGIL